MYRSDVRARLEGSLDPHPAPIPGEGDRLAAVLLPLVEGDRLVLTRRTEHLSRHPGEISFPGGLTHEEDVDLSATALRETQEELGLAPDDVEVPARSSRSTPSCPILIVPFVGMVSAAPVFTPSEAEIAEVLSYPLDELMAAETTVEWPRDGLVYRGFAYPMSDGNTIWGATATIVNELMAIVRSRS
jgi:8-oxo-dGTP pyrophosphatase MutT (NUDIX family)